MIPRLVSIVCVLALECAALADSGWRRIAYEEGITVLERDAPGRDFPTFRGIGNIEASIYDVVAVIRDIKRHTEWMENILISRQLKREGDLQFVIYMRINAPWPVSDRDAVYRSKTEIKRNHRDVEEVNITFKAVRRRFKGRVSGVVRMNNFQGHYRFKALGPTRTRVDYQVDADPGGWLPTWLAKLASKYLPLDTLRRMRKQVARTRGWYAKRIARWKVGDYR